MHLKDPGTPRGGALPLSAARPVINRLAARLSFRLSSPVWVASSQPGGTIEERSILTVIKAFTLPAWLSFSEVLLPVSAIPENQVPDELSASTDH